MSAISRCLLIGWVLLASGGGLYAVEIGYVRVVNVLDRGLGAMHVSIDGRALRPAGYGYGDISGTLVLPAGKHRMGFERDGVSGSKVGVDVLPGRTVGVVVYGVEEVKSGKPSGRWRIRVLRVTLDPAGDRRLLHLVSVVPGDAVALDVGQSNGEWETVNARYAAVASMPIKQGRGYLAMRCKGRELVSIPVEEQGNHVVVMHHDGDGLPAVVSYVERVAWIPVAD